jgi:hypothetical protein
MLEIQRTLRQGQRQDKQRERKDKIMPKTGGKNTGTTGKTERKQRGEQRRKR